MDTGVTAINFIIEGENDVDVQYLLEIALLIKEYNPTLFVSFKTEEEYPSFIQPSLHTPFPFDEVIYKSTE